MNLKYLALKIVIVMAVATILVGSVIAVTILDASVEQHKLSVTRWASSTASLIGGIDNQKLVEAGPERYGTLTEHALARVESVLGDELVVGVVPDTMLVRHGDRGPVILYRHSHSDDAGRRDYNVQSGSEFSRVVLNAINADAGVAVVRGLAGQEVVLGYASVPDTDLAVLAEMPLSDIRAPYIRILILCALFAAVAILVSTFIVYRSVQKLVSSAARSEKRSVSALRIAGLAQEEAETARDRLMDAIEASADGFALFDKDDHLVVFNNKYREIHEGHDEVLRPGTSFEEFLRFGLRKGAYPEAIGKEEEWLAARLEQHRNPQGTFEQRMSSGRWLSISERPTSDGGIVGVRADVTDLKEKELALRRSEERFRDFTQTASDWVWETDEQHRFRPFDDNDRLSGLLGSVIAGGMTRTELTIEDTANEKWREHNEFLDAHLPFRNFRYWVRSINGEDRLMKVSGVPVFDEVGNFTGYRGTGSDVTSEHRVIERLRSAENRFRVAFDSVTSGIVLSDEKGRILDFNTAAEEMFGYARREVRGLNVSILSAEPYRSEHDGYLRNYLETGEKKIIGKGREVTGRKKNGKEFPLFLGIAEMEHDGKRQFIASMVDISIEKRLEGQLRQSQKMEAVGQLVGGIAHDFNNLLGIIIGNLELALRRIDPETKPHVQVGKAVGAANRGAALTRRLLNFSRQAPVEAAAIDVNACIGDIVELIRKSLTNSITVDLRLDSRSPEAFADRGDFEDALINLSLNARDAMPDGGVLTISTESTEVGTVYRPIDGLEPGHYVRIAVADSGVGIAPEDRSRIFEPFFSTKEAGKSTGLGLAMVYGFVRRSKGTVNVRSEVGSGTEFSIHLPVAMPGEVKPATGPKEHDQTDLEGGTETILVVDDETELADVAASLLTELGYRVLVSHDGVSALADFGEHPEIDMLFTDVVMPGGVDGFQLADQTIAMKPELKVGVATGYSRGLNAERNVGDRIYPVLAKPYAPSELARFIRQVLDHGDGGAGR